jgi:ABC-type Mn2+/Zn2+ transport system ATPase subunit
MSAEPEIILMARDVSLSYDGGCVLSGVDLTVRLGELWGFVGPNGEGKTTLLRAILGGLRPRSGALHLADSIRDGWRIGFVPQRCDVRKTLPLTVEDFVLLGLGARRVSRRHAIAAAREALDTVSIAGLAAHDYWSVSGGQRQRALIARGLIGGPELLLLDEPTNGLDVAAVEALLDLMAKLNRERRLTIVLVTHAIPHVIRYASHAALFHAGRVISGRVEDVLSAPHLRRAYGIDVDPLALPGGAPLLHPRAGAP